MHGVRGEASKCDRRCGVWPGVDGAKGLRAGRGLPARSVAVSRKPQIGAHVWLWLLDWHCNVRFVTSSLRLLT
jgi:hypothetical protein